MPIKSYVQKRNVMRDLPVLACQPASLPAYRAQSALRVCLGRWSDCKSRGTRLEYSESWRQIESRYATQHVSELWGTASCLPELLVAPRHQRRGADTMPERSYSAAREAPPHAGRDHRRSIPHRGARWDVSPMQ